MKVDTKRAAAAPEKPKPEFKEVLKIVAKPAAKMPPPLPSRLPRSTGTSTSLAPGHSAAFSEARAHAHRVVEVRSQARLGMEQKVEKAQEVRTDGVCQHEHKTEAKVLELIARELKEDKPEPVKEVGVESKAATVTHFQRPTSAAAQSGESKADSKVGGIMELVERIRVFERAGRPAMAFTVGGSLDAHVEIERAGPKLVTLKLVGKSKVPSAAKLNELRDELGRRGIKVASMSISAR